MAIKIIKKKYETFLKNVSYLTIGQALTILIRTFTFTFIVRTLEIAQYGQLITVIGYCSFFQILTLPGMGKPIFRSACRDPKQLDSILSSKIKLRYLLAIIATVSANIAVGFFDYDQNVVRLIRVFSLSVIINNLIEYLRYVFRVHEEFKWISASEILKSISYLLLAILSLKFSLGINALVYSSLMSILLAFFFDYYNSRKFSKFSLFGKLELDSTFLKSASLFTITNILWQIISKIDVVMLSVIGTDVDVGIFNVGKQLVFYGLMGLTILSSVLYPPIVKKLAKEPIDFVKNKKKIFAGIAVSFICCLLLFTFGESIIRLIAGNKYSESVIILKILTIFLFLQTLISPLGIILNAMDREFSLFLTALPLPIIKIGLNYLLFN